MEGNQMSHADSLKAQIYEDFLNSIASVRSGMNPNIAFRDHETRVSQLRMQVAAAEMGHGRQADVLSLVA
jgi:hypothetical protein